MCKVQNIWNASTKLHLRIGLQSVDGQTSYGVHLRRWHIDIANIDVLCNFTTFFLHVQQKMTGKLKSLIIFLHGEKMFGTMEKLFFRRVEISRIDIKL